VSAAKEILAAQKTSGGRGFRLLTETVASPTLAAQIRALLETMPQAKWVQWEPAGRHNAREGSRLAFGEYVEAQYAVDKADVICHSTPTSCASALRVLRHARAFASRRRARGRSRTDQSSLRRREHADEHREQGRITGFRCVRRRFPPSPRPWRRGWVSPARRARIFPRPRRGGSIRWSRICRARAAAAS
jgi:hypothetical protein